MINDDRAVLSDQTGAHSSLVTTIMDFKEIARERGRLKTEIKFNGGRMHMQEDE